MGKRMARMGEWMSWGAVVLLSGACNSLLGTDAIKTDGCPTVGAIDCANVSTPQVCGANGKWEKRPACVNQTCNAGVCVGECGTGLWRCDGRAPQLCNENGQWKNDGPVCEHVCFGEGNCGGDCAPGEKRCDENTPQTCNGDGRWKSADSPCSGQTCDKETGTCVGQCQPGHVECFGNQRFQCDANGLLGSGEEPCVNSTCHFLGCIGICVGGERRCNGNVVELCDGGGQWNYDASCVGQTCAAGACTGVCEPGTRCGGETVQSCGINGQWKDDEVCSGTLHCGGGACIEACVAGDLRCQGNASYICAGGVWQEKEKCLGQTCVTASGTCAGVCALNDARCSGQTPEICDANGLWKKLPTCTGTCVSGTCPGPSCAGLPETCGPNKNENCCAGRVVPMTKYDRGNDSAFPATVSEFRLDRFEVTVGRYRKFAEAYAEPTFAEDAGAHPAITGSGWQAAWNEKLPETFADVKFAVQCGGEYQTFTSAPGPKDELPLNCVNWYLAFAFCIWDGGRLPTEAEWHAAASGGSEQRRFPWSNPPVSPKIDGSFAAYDCMADGSPALMCSVSDIRPVGSRSPRGDGKFGHADLAGNILEWTLDTYDPNYRIPCIDCAVLSDNGDRILRGGVFTSTSSQLRNITRFSSAPDSTSFQTTIGFRCARTP